MSPIKQLFALTLTAALAAPALAQAQVVVDENQQQGAEPTATPGADAPPTAPSQLDAPHSDDDVQPEVAAVGLPPGGAVSQAGVGGDTGYGRAGVLELGGSAGLSVATNVTAFNLSPTVGWFLADNLELSLIVGLQHFAVKGASGQTIFSALIEPSYHLPFTRTMFAFLGLGIGGAYSPGGGGFAIAPRIGANFLIGRSGVLTPSIAYSYTTLDAAGGGPGTTGQLAVTPALLINVGYTVMW